MNAVPFLRPYSSPGIYDEMFTSDGTVRSEYRQFAEGFSQLTPPEFEARRLDADVAFMRQGVTFNVYGDSQGAERIFPFDLIPRIISAKEWEHIEAGLVQRITALNLFLHDIYHDQHIVTDG